jgi:hypothetical protein
VISLLNIMPKLRIKRVDGSNTNTQRAESKHQHTTDVEITLPLADAGDTRVLGFAERRQTLYVAARFFGG